MIIAMAIYNIYAPKSIIILRNSGTGSLPTHTHTCKTVKLNQSSIISLVQCMRILNLMAGLGQTHRQTERQTNRQQNKQIER